MANTTTAIAEAVETIVGAAGPTTGTSTKKAMTITFLPRKLAQNGCSYRLCQSAKTNATSLPAIVACPHVHASSVIEIL